MAYFDSSGGLHNTEEEARRASSGGGSFESAGASVIAVIAGIGFVIMCAVWLILYNILYLLIFAAAIIIRIVLNKVIEAYVDNGFLRFLAKFGTLLIVLGTLAFFAYSIALNPKLEMPIVAEATFKDNAKIWKSVLSDQEKEKNVVATLEQGGKVRVLGINSKGNLKVQTADGKVGYTVLSKMEESKVMEPYTMGFFQKMTSFNLTKKPLVILPGYYSTEGMKKWQDANTIHYTTLGGFEGFKSGIENDVAAKDEPVMLKGLPYYYTFTLKKYEGGEAIKDENGEYIKENGDYVRIYTYPDDKRNGTYVITSPESFVDEKGVKWIWYGNDANALRRKYP